MNQMDFVRNNNWENEFYFFYFSVQWFDFDCFEHNLFVVNETIKALIKTPITLFLEINLFLFDSLNR